MVHRPVIFLDFDGVLNCDQCRHFQTERMPELCQHCIKQFNRIVATTGARIVISSAWRGLITAGQMSMNGFRCLMRSHGIVDDVIGITPTENYPETRADEIAAWLRDNPCTRYVVLDDDAEAGGSHPFVKTSAWVGLTEAGADRAIALLTE